MTFLVETGVKSCWIHQPLDHQCWIRRRLIGLVPWPQQSPSNRCTACQSDSVEVEVTVRGTKLVKLVVVRDDGRRGLDQLLVNKGKVGWGC